MSVGLRKDRTEHGPDELAYVKHRTVVDGIEAPALTREVNAKFHSGLPVRTISAIRMMRTKHGWNVNPTPTGQTQVPVEKEQEVKREETADGMTFLAVGRRIKTLEDLIAHVGLDLTKYEVHEPAATSWDVTLRDPETGEPTTVQNHRIAFKARPKTGPNLQERVEAIVAGAFKTRTILARPVVKAVFKNGLMQAVFIMDPHIGKRAWGAETRRGNYDLPIGIATLRDANAHHIRCGDDRKVAERVLFIGGDYFNADTKAGTTTGGTPQDNDSRLPKMFEEGSRALFDIIEWSAEKVPTKVVVVPGNHDSASAWALQFALQCYFRKDKRVTIDTGHQTRKYHVHGKCLIGLTHGDKAWKRLPGLMSREAAFEWGRTTLRHIHHGHLHSKRQIDTVDGVTVFQHPALCESDFWHSEEGYVSDRGQESYYYHESGILVGMDFYSPDVNAEVSKGAR